MKLTGSVSVYLPFGKHKGEDIVDVPLPYLKWFEENIPEMPTALRTAINFEIGRREGNVTSQGRKV